MSTDERIPADGGCEDAPFAWPTEAEIIILPDGEVVFADLPAELIPLVQQLGRTTPCEVLPGHDKAQTAPDARTGL